jgi:hypothetical protein
MAPKRVGTFMFGLFDLVAKLFDGHVQLSNNIYALLCVYRLFTLQLIEIMPAAPIYNSQSRICDCISDAFKAHTYNTHHTARATTTTRTCNTTCWTLIQIITSCQPLRSGDGALQKWKNAESHTHIIE